MLRHLGDHLGRNTQLDCFHQVDGGRLIGINKEALVLRRPMAK